MIIRAITTGIFAALLSPAQTPPARPLAYRVSTYAGIPWNASGPAQAPNVMFKLPFGVALDSAGNLYIANYEMHLIRKIAPDGAATTVAGDGNDSRILFFGETPAQTVRRLTFPRAIAVDGNRYLYIGEPIVSRIKRLNLETNEITIIVGGNGAGFSPDGTAGTAARLNETLGLAVEASGNLLIAETGSHRIRRWNAATGTLTTVAGTGTAGFTGDDGPATDARLNRPIGIAAHPNGDIYFYDFDNRRVRRIRGATITTIAGTPTGTTSQGPGPQVNFGQSTGIALDREGRNLYITSESTHRIYKLQLSDNTVTVVSGTGGAGRVSENANAQQAAFSTPTGVAVDALGGVIVGDTNNHRIRRIGPDNVVRSVAGLTRYGLDASSAPDKAVFDGIGSIRLDARGALVVTDSGHCMIRTVTATAVTTVLGATGTCLNSLAGVNSAVLDADRNLFYLTAQGLFFRPAAGGAAVQRNNNTGRALTLSRDGNNLYYLEQGRAWLYSVSRATALTASATPFLIGGSRGPGNADGPLTTAQFLVPSDITQAANGDLLLADQNGVRRIRANEVSTIRPPIFSYSVAVDSTDTLWVGSAARLGRINAQGLMDTLVGATTFEYGYSPDGAADLAVRVGSLVTLAAGRDGVIYMNDVGNNVIRQMVPVAIESLVKVDGDNQTGAPGNPLAAPLRVRVMGADGAPLPGIPVFASAPHLGQPVAAIANAQGEVTLPLIYPLAPGRFTVTVSTVGTSPVTVTFTATAVAPVSVASVSVAPEYGAGAIAPGSLVEIRGASLAAASSTGADAAVRVLFHDLAATIVSVTPERIVCLVPETLTPGATRLFVVPEGGTATGEGFALEVVARAPALLAPADLNTEGKQFVHAQLDGGELAGPAGLLPNTRPARAGEKLSFTATGLGAAPGSVMIQFGEAEPVAAELSAGPQDAYRLDAVVPEGLQGEVAVRIIVDGVTGAQILLTAIS